MKKVKLRAFLAYIFLINKAPRNFLFTFMVTQKT